MTVRLSSLPPVTSPSFSPTLLQGFVALPAPFKTPPLAQVTLWAALCVPLPAAVLLNHPVHHHLRPQLSSCFVPSRRCPPHPRHLMMCPIKKALVFNPFQSSRKQLAGDPLRSQGRALPCLSEIKLWNFSVFTASAAFSSNYIKYFIWLRMTRELPRTLLWYFRSFFLDLILLSNK